MWGIAYSLKRRHFNFFNKVACFKSNFSFFFIYFLLCLKAVPDFMYYDEEEYSDDEVDHGVKSKYVLDHTKVSQGKPSRIYPWQQIMKNLFFIWSFIFKGFPCSWPDLWLIKTTISLIPTPKINMRVELTKLKYINLYKSQKKKNLCFVGYCLYCTYTLVYSVYIMKKGVPRLIVRLRAS